MAYAVAMKAKSGKALYFGPNKAHGPWHRNPDAIKRYSDVSVARSAAERANGWVVNHEDAAADCGARSHPCMMG